MSSADDLSETFFLDPILEALTTTHRHLAIDAGDAVRYQSEVAPFAAVRICTDEAIEQLRDLLQVGESIVLCREKFPSVTGLVSRGLHHYHQMALPSRIEPPASNNPIVPLTCSDAAEMFALSRVAFPDFLRLRSCEMGEYYGIRLDGALIAMVGNRCTFGRYSELSGLCTHPDYRGRGLGEDLLWHAVRVHRSKGLTSWLHVAADNAGAIKLYRRMGFQIVRTIVTSEVARSE